MLYRSSNGWSEQSFSDPAEHSAMLLERTELLRAEGRPCISWFIDLEQTFTPFFKQCSPNTTSPEVCFFLQRYALYRTWFKKETRFTSSLIECGTLNSIKRYIENKNRKGCSRTSASHADAVLSHSWWPFCLVFISCSLLCSLLFRFTGNPPTRELGPKL